MALDAGAQARQVQLLGDLVKQQKETNRLLAEQVKATQYSNHVLYAVLEQLKTDKSSD